MIDIILTILGVSIFLPWIIQTISTQWNTSSWHRQLLIAAIALELITTLYIPSVMYIGIGILLTAFIIYIIKERPKMRLTPIFIIAVLYFLWYAISLLWSQAPKKGALFLIDNGLILVGITAITCFIQLKREEYTHILRQFCYSACIFVVLGILSWFISTIEIQMPLWKWPILQKEAVHGSLTYSWIFRFLGGQDGYIHPSYNLLPIFIATPIAAWLKKNDEYYRFLWYFLWAGGLALTLLSQSRMGIIYTSIIFVCNSIYLLNSRRTKMYAAFGFCVTTCISLGISMNFWQDYGIDKTRDQLHTYTLRYIAAKPLTGAGAGALNPIEICNTINQTSWPRVGKIDPSMDVEDWKPKAHMLPHNQWLADAAHAGIIAALISMALYIAIAVRCNTIKSFWGGMFLLIFTIFSLLEPPLYIGKGLYLFCLLTCLLYSSPPKEKINQHLLIE